MKKILSYISCIALIFYFLPVRLFADSNTYVVIPANTCYFVCGQIGTFGYNTLINSSVEIRSVGIVRSGTVYWFGISEVSGHYGRSEGNFTPSSCNVSVGSSSFQSRYYGGSYSGHLFYFVSEGLGSVSRYYNGNYPLIYDDSSKNMTDLAYDYTFGENSIFGPEFGDLVNVGYNTKIAGSGQAAINNLDTVSWNPEIDTSGNDISEMSVSIRAVPGKYSADSRQSLAEKLYSDFVLNTLDATVLDTVSASSGSFSVTWSDVIDELAIPFATISSLIDQDGTFIKNGWIYQVRLEGDGYEGEWQTVYTATSSGVKNDLTIIQSTMINQSLVNTITEINQLNNTENNWYINETTINMSDYTEPSEGDKPWWAYLLEAIVSLINKLVDGISSIVGAIADLVGDIIDGILGLFTFDSFSVPDFSTHQQNIHDNSGIFGESIDLLQTMNQTISNADSTAEPILYYPGIDLEGVEFIPEITINLNDYVEDLGLTQWHNLAYTCTDIFIWSTLIYTIYRKLIGVFKK